jgi:hypothetical protein
METETRQTKTAVIAGLRAELNPVTIPVLEAVDGDTRDAPWDGDPGVRMSRQQRRAAARAAHTQERVATTLSPASGMPVPGCTTTTNLCDETLGRAGEPLPDVAGGAPVF